MDLEKISHYQIVRMIGSGGMGEVYLAEDPRLKRSVAIKILRIESAADAEKAARFEKEARAASALNHPNILTVFDVGETGSFHYMVTEFVEGQTLREYFRHGPVPIRKAAEIAASVARALEAAHNAGIVHRDVKPENIMIRTDGMVKVLDFGLAKLTASGNSGNSLVNYDPGCHIGNAKIHVT
jgi:serine/threonine protein kinase